MHFLILLGQIQFSSSQQLHRSDMTLLWSCKRFWKTVEGTSCKRHTSAPPTVLSNYRNCDQVSLLTTIGRYFFFSPRETSVSASNKKEWSLAVVYEQYFVCCLFCSPVNLFQYILFDFRCLSHIGLCHDASQHRSSWTEHRSADDISWVHRKPGRLERRGALSQRCIDSHLPKY